MSDEPTAARPATAEDLKALLVELNRSGVEYFLIGGYALAAHGYQRATTDIDVMFPATARAGEQAKAALMSLPDHAAKDIDPIWFEEGENIRVADEIIVDIMLNANGYTFEALRQYLITVDFEGVPVQTISLEGLLLTKQTMREKDAGDRVVIERAIAAISANSVAREQQAASGPRGDSPS